MSEWNDISNMPFQVVCWVRNPQMKDPVMATRGYATELGVHPDDTFCTSVYTPHKFFPTMPGHLVCPTEWKLVDDQA